MAPAVASTLCLVSVADRQLTTGFAESGGNKIRSSSDWYRKPTAYRTAFPGERVIHLEAAGLRNTGDPKADQQAERAVGDLRPV